MSQHTPDLLESRLLLVEDSAEDAFLLEHAFKKIGFRPPYDRVENGIEAQDYLLRTHAYTHLCCQPLPRLILSDIKMPLCTGLELLTWLRGHPEFRDVPVVMWSSSDFEKDVRAANTSGASYYLPKPSGLNGFLDVARTLEQIWRYDCHAAAVPALHHSPDASQYNFAPRLSQ